LIVGIDPSSGASSPVGLSVIDSNSYEILFTTNVTSKHKALHHRIKEIADTVESVLMELAATGLPVKIYIEYFVMRGKAGESIQRTIGGIMSRIPLKGFSLDFVQNSTVKKVIAGHGQADKLAVAMGLSKYFPENKIIKSLISSKEFDILDSLAIGVTGWLESKKK